jgi:hypothetical protein
MEEVITRWPSLQPWPFLLITALSAARRTKFPHIPGFHHSERGGAPAARGAQWSWPDLVRHTFGVDVLACTRCGDRMRVVATIEDPVVIRRILTHLGLPTAAAAPRPPPADLFDWS